MRVSASSLILATSSLGLLAGTISSSIPVRRRGLSSYETSSRNALLGKRQDDDYDIQETKALRDAVDYRKIYKNQDEVNWYEINKQTNKFESTHKTGKGENEIPNPNDDVQGGSFVVDHIFELQVIVYAFSNANKEISDKSKAVPRAAWDKAAECVNGVGQGSDKTKLVAQKVSVTKNLSGIGNRINTMKETIFYRVTQGNDQSNLDPKWNDYIKGMEDYLTSSQTNVESTIDDMATVLSSNEVAGDTKVGDYFKEYCKARFQAGIDYVHKQSSSSNSNPECVLSDECQQDVSTVDQPSQNAINPACKCTCNGQDTPLTDSRCLPNLQGETQTQCNKDDPTTSVSDIQKIIDGLNKAGDGVEVCGSAVDSENGPCRSVDSQGTNTYVSLCNNEGCIGSARLANYVQGMVDHCKVGDVVSAKQDVNEVPGLQVQI